MQLSGIWYKVRHPWFDPEWAYQAVGLTRFSETAWGQLDFILPAGHTVGVQVFRCTALPRTCEQRHIDHSQLSREQTETERMFPWAGKLDTPNPDLNTDL